MISDWVYLLAYSNLFGIKGGGGVVLLRNIYCGVALTQRKICLFN
jgi:hypothetical protein